MPRVGKTLRPHCHFVMEGPRKAIETTMAHPSHASFLFSCEEGLPSAMSFVRWKANSFLDFGNGNYRGSPTFRQVSNVPSVKKATAKDFGTQNNGSKASSLINMTCIRAFMEGAKIENQVGYLTNREEKAIDVNESVFNSFQFNSKII